MAHLSANPMCVSSVRDPGGLRIVKGTGYYPSRVPGVVESRVSRIALRGADLS